MLKNICAGLMSAALLTGGLTTYAGAEPVHVPTLADMSVQVKEPTVQEQRLAQETGKAVASAPVAPVAESQPAAATTAAAEVKKAEPAAAEPEKKSLEKKISINLAARSLALGEEVFGKEDFH